MVSIIIPYNKDRGFLDEAIESVRKQNYGGKIEIILSESDNGVSYNLNRGIEMAKGEFIKYLCEDDYLTPNSISDSVNTFTKGVDFIHGNATNVFRTHKQIQYPRLKNPTLNDMIVSNVIHGGSLMYRKSVFKKVGLFDETLTCAEEYDFNLRCLKLGLKLGYCPQNLYNYRRHDEQKSLGKGINQEERALKIKAIQDKWK